MGCAGDPDLATSSSDLRTEIIERAAWEHASPGCENAERLGAELHPAAGEPLLAVLVSQGRVLCVDSMSLLVQETREDPTPTPLLPLALQDPTPTPALDE